MAIQVVSFRCTLKNTLGHVLSSTYNHEVLAGMAGEKDSIPALSKALQNLRPGERRRISLSAEQAYGFYDPKRVLVLNFDDIDVEAPLQVGDSVVYEHKGKSRTYSVSQVSGDTLTLDGNHPLAGLDLIFEIEATDTREATKEDLGGGTVIELDLAPDGGYLN